MFFIVEVMQYLNDLKHLNMCSILFLLKLCSLFLLLPLLGTQLKFDYNWLIIIEISECSISVAMLNLREKEFIK